ncbi:MAG: hypothetical protein R2795_05455 [Saprospiraceae bacterium]
MTLPQKKIGIIQWILNIEDEYLVEQVVASITAIQKNTQHFSQDVDAVHIGDIFQHVLDINTLKKDQEVYALKRDEVERLIKEADIQESLPSLLSVL